MSLYSFMTDECMCLSAIIRVAQPGASSLLNARALPGSGCKVVISPVDFLNMRLFTNCVSLHIVCPL